MIGEIGQDKGTSQCKHPKQGTKSHTCRHSTVGPVLSTRDGMPPRIGPFNRFCSLASVFVDCEGTLLGNDCGPPIFEFYCMHEMA